MITGGSSVDFDTKRQKRDHYRSINHIAVTGLVVQTKWSHVPLTFDARDVDLRSAPHIDAMVINCSVAGWDLHKVLVDNGSQADIIFLHAFDRMGISHSLLKPSDNPVAYPTWLANVVMVQKKSGKWRMCIDFTGLNKACPKDNFPLPRIDKIVDSTAGCKVMSLLDCFSGYHQIYMKEEDKASTSFITPFGMYCFIRMPEGLKNAGSTFSRLTKTVLESQVGRNIFTYVDDIPSPAKAKKTIWLTSQKRSRTCGTHDFA
jgi:hypothetical protein